MQYRELGLLSGTVTWTDLVRCTAEEDSPQSEHFCSARKWYQTFYSRVKYKFFQWWSFLPIPCQLLANSCDILGAVNMWWQCRYRSHRPIGTQNLVVYVYGSVHHNTRWFKYDRYCLHLFTYKLVPVIFEPPCIHVNLWNKTTEGSRLSHSHWSFFCILIL